LASRCKLIGAIIKRKRKDRPVAWLARIAVRPAGKTVWRESRTFDLRPTAAAWIEKREKHLARRGALENPPVGETRRRDVPSASRSTNMWKTARRQSVGPGRRC